MPKQEKYCGLLLIGDPHLEGRQPGFRSDDYPKAILGKIEWCIDYAKRERLLPVFLGDFFDKPRDNPTWLIGQLIDLLIATETIGIYGNHDCAETKLSENDSLSILLKAGCIRLVSQTDPWVGEINGRTTFVGGSSYRELVPEKFEPASEHTSNGNPFVAWLTHHDVNVPGYESVGRFTPFEIENVDLLVNGHIHRRLDPVRKGQTLWMTPGNISRRSRKDAVKEHKPAALRVNIDKEDYKTEYVEIPHAKFEDVFHPLLLDPEEELGPSLFIDGLAQLRSVRTDSGAGLKEFIAQNISKFEKPVALEIQRLADKVTEKHLAALQKETSDG